MSEELEWEMYDIFESGLFAFPIYDHNSARRIVRYLLMRGILAEEIADGIEDSTVDMYLWLNRSGKHMVGEWVIAWLNDCREDYTKEHHLEHSRTGIDRELWIEAFGVDSYFAYTGDGGDDDDDDDGGDGERGIEEERSDSRVTDLESISSLAATSVSTDLMLDELHDHEDHEDQGRESMENDTPPPLPPRALSESDGCTLKSKALRPTDLDLSFRNNSLNNSSQDGIYEAPDSGHHSDLYTCIPPDTLMDSLDITATISAVKLQCQPGSPHSSHSIGTQDRMHERLARCEACTCSLTHCTCTLPHYSYIARQHSGTTQKDASSPTSNHSTNNNLKDEEDNETNGVNNLDNGHYELYDLAVDNRALEINIETLDRDGPGYIYIMTDSIKNCLPWSTDHRYKISSSRQPEKCLMEFRSRNIDIDLIWQVKVRLHLQAVKEVQQNLCKYNLHSNWYKCSLSLIMDSLSRVARHYK